MWRLDKNWNGLRREVPWVDRLPSEMIRELGAPHRPAARRPDDEPARAAARSLDRLGSDRMLMFATDYPHRQFDDPAHDGARGPVRRRAAARFLGGNALDTYRLGGDRLC